LIGSFRAAENQKKPEETIKMRVLLLLALFVGILAVQALLMKETFGSSQGGAQIQLVASRPVYYLAAE
jgi:hypothetical protein